MGLGRVPDPSGIQLSPAASHSPPSQAVTIITYKEPENPEYQPFLARLKEEALAHFNFSMKDGLVGHGGMEPGKLGGTGLGGHRRELGLLRDMGWRWRQGDMGWSWGC